METTTDLAGWAPHADADDAGTQSNSFPTLQRSAYGCLWVHTCSTRESPGR